ncbi:hypothetical protein [Yoonia sp. BS5-3]|uniref:GtrA-like protein domain-containing protein n=1 Tax=Yoonia phaeophyticola TaxID=3137369 RepID=A0ABZ2VBW2_9RHOB
MGLVHMGTTPFVASMAGAALAVTFVYVVSRLVVFSGGQIGTTTDFVLYIIWQICAISVASALVGWIAFAITPALNGASAFTGIAPLTLGAGLAKAIVTPLTLGMNFLFMKWLTHRGSNPARKGQT